MLAYPLQISPTGGLLLSEDPLGDRIRFFLDTRYWERVMFPDFGLPDEVFYPVTAEDVSRLVAIVTVALHYWIDPDIKVSSTSLPTEDGIVELVIEYGVDQILRFQPDRHPDFNAPIGESGWVQISGGAWQVNYNPTLQLINNRFGGEGNEIYVFRPDVKECYVTPNFPGILRYQNLDLSYGQWSPYTSDGFAVSQATYEADKLTGILLV